MHLSTRIRQIGTRTASPWTEWKAFVAVPHTGAQPAVSTNQASKTCRNQLITGITSGEISATWTSWNFLVMATAFRWSMWTSVDTRLAVAPRYNSGSFRTATSLTWTTVSLAVSSNLTLGLCPVKIILVSITLSTATSVAPREMMRWPSGGLVDTWLDWSVAQIKEDNSKWPVNVSSIINSFKQHLSSFNNVNEK